MPDITAPSGRGWPNTFDPMDQGMAIEDVWPSLFAGAARLAEAKRKVSQCAWARDAVALWTTEADRVLAEEPAFVAGNTGGRGYFDDDMQHFRFDPHQSAEVHCRALGTCIPHTEESAATWRLYQHERLRRILGSLALLFALTQDERLSAWVWRGLEDCATGIYAPENHADPNKDMASVIYGGLYEAQSALQLVQALELLEAGGAGAGHEPVREALIRNALAPIGEALMRWMNVMDPFNMTVWSMAALAELGRYLKREEWLTRALTAERNGLLTLIRTGLPRRGPDNRPDGWWFETSTFYNLYAIIPLIPLYEAGKAAGLIDADLQERFASAFAAPLNLCDDRLDLVVVGDRLIPGGFNLTQFRHFYEYAAGQVDRERYGPVLAMLYARSGAPRANLAALTWGPDTLPPAGSPPSRSTVMPAARVVTFRGETCVGKATCFFLAGEENTRNQGHHHFDKLSISLHAGNEVITSDPGLPHQHYHLMSSFLHNTLMVDESSQGSLKCLAFDADLAAETPWACARMQGDWDKNVTRLHELGEKRELHMDKAAYEGASLERRVEFALPCIRLVDRFELPTARRCNFVFHAHGSMDVEAERCEETLPDLPPLPDTIEYRTFFARQSLGPLRSICATWRLRSDFWLHLRTTCSAPFAAVWGRSHGNPRSRSRGTILLRAPGSRVSFMTVLTLEG